MKLKIIISSLSFLLLFSCKKKVEDKYPDFVGNWECYDYSPDFRVYLTIDKNSRASYTEMRYGGQTTNLKGLCKANSNKLKIGNIFHFNIITLPHKVDTTLSNTYIIWTWSGANGYVSKKANWEMELSGLQPSLYLDGPFHFHKADY